MNETVMTAFFREVARRNIVPNVQEQVQELCSYSIGEGGTNQILYLCNNGQLIARFTSHPNQVADFDFQELFTLIKAIANKPNEEMNQLLNVEQQTSTGAIFYIQTHNGSVSDDHPLQLYGSLRINSMPNQSISFLNLQTFFDRCGESLGKKFDIFDGKSLEADLAGASVTPLFRVQGNEQQPKKNLKDIVSGIIADAINGYTHNFLEELLAREHTDSPILDNEFVLYTVDKLSYDSLFCSVQDRVSLIQRFRYHLNGANPLQKSPDCHQLAMHIPEYSDAVMKFSQLGFNLRLVISGGSDSTLPSLFLRITRKTPIVSTYMSQVAGRLHEALSDGAESTFFPVFYTRSDLYNAAIPNLKWYSIFPTTKTLLMTFPAIRDLSSECKENGYELVVLSTPPRNADHALFLSFVGISLPLQIGISKK